MKYHRLALVGAASIAMGCSGDGCGCTEPTPGGFPSAERTSNAIQVRVTPTALAAIEADPAALVGSFLGTSNGAFPLPASCGGDPEICCDNGQPVDPCGPINLDFVPQAGDAPRLEVNPTNGNGQVQVVTRMRVVTAADIPVRTQGQNCRISIDTTNSGNESIEIVLDVNLRVDPTTRTTELANVNATVNDLVNGDFDLSGGFVCTLAELLLKGTIRDQLIGALETTLEDQISNLSCKQCPSGDVADCGEFGDACSGGTCMRGGACLQELGLAGRVIGDAAFAGFSSGQLGAMDIYDVAGGYSETSTGGISLGVLAGAIPAGTERDRCGPAGTAPPFSASVARSSFFTGNSRPDTGNDFDVGIGIHQYNLDLLSYAAYDSGLLCLNIGPTAVDLLTAETFSLVMPSLLGLAHNQPAPVVLGLRPQSAPVMTLGAGSTLPDGSIDEPLINLEMPGLEIDFFAMIDDQFIRVMTLASDVTLPINLEANDMGQLTPVLGADGAFANLSVRNSEALTESPADLAEQFPLLLDLALPMLAGGLQIDLPLLGSLELRVQPDGITSIESNSILAIFADLAVASPSARQAARVQTTASIARVQLPEASAFTAPHLHADQRPTVIVDLGGEAASGADLEWSFRVDGGLWSTYSKQRQRAIAAKTLWLEGRHKIEVRAREVGRAHTTDRTPVVLEVPIDHVGPRLRTLRGFSDQLLVSATDYVDTRDLAFEVELEGRPKQTIEGVPAGALVAIDLDGTSMERALVRAIDSSGNRSDEGLGDLIGFHGSGDAAGCNCETSSGSAGGWIALLFVGLLLGTARRARRGARSTAKVIVMLALLVLAAPACNCGSSNDCGDNPCQDGEVTRGPTGRYLSAASNSERTVLAAYDERLGDLVLIDATDPASFVYTAVDGVPENATPSFDPDGYRGGITAEGPNVGAWTSVALEGAEARLSYQDLETMQLKFARQDGDSFSTHLVDGVGGERAGFYSSIAMRGGVPTIAYQVIGAEGPDGTVLSQLRMATASSATPTSSDGWNVTVIDETTISCAGLCEGTFVCVLADPMIGEVCTAATLDCSTTCADGEACVSGSCLAVVAPAPSVDLNPGTGLFANNLTLADGRAAVVFYRRSSGDLVIAVENGGAWEVTELDAATRTDTGAFAAAVLGPDGLVHVGYQDAVGDRVFYLATDGATVTAGPDLVDDGVRSGEMRTHPVGAGLAIAARGSEIVLAYQDGLSSDVAISRGAIGSWTRAAALVGPTLDGFYNRIAGAIIASYSYDRSLPQPGTIATIPLQ